jgi:hypothetical protein
MTKRSFLSATLSLFSGSSEPPKTGTDISPVFQVAPLSSQERTKMSKILQTHSIEEYETDVDLRTLSNLTAEIKAINCQAAILHGERIKKAQEILKRYRDGAFTEWLIATYGNRQTPYNFLQYYELYRNIPKPLSEKLDEMPRQIAYALASRAGSVEQKIDLIQNYTGQSKEEMMTSIRKLFPLAIEDKRAHDPIRAIADNLKRIERQMRDSSFSPSEEQKEGLKKIFLEMQTLVS